MENVNVVDLLLPHEKDAKGSDGLTPLERAAKNGNEKIGMMLARSEQE